MTYRYAIDSLVVRNGRCFGWGWFIDDLLPARSCELRVPLVSGDEQMIACIPGGMREDLREAFPAVRHAAAAGFLIQGRLSPDLAYDRAAVLVATLVDGSQRRCEVPASLLSADVGEPGAGIGGVLASWQRTLTTVPASVRARGWKATARAAVSRGREQLQRVERQWRLRRLGSASGRSALVLDHAMGGGANHYRTGLVARLSSTADHVVVISPLLHLLQYEVEYHSNGRVDRWAVDSLAPVLAALETAPQLDIHVNELVSFEDPLALMVWCRARRQQQRGELVMYVHDYHAVCPAWTLIGTDGAFCDIPSPDVCRQCLPRNFANTLGFSQDIPVDRWRSAWGEFLGACDRVIAFSRASVAILHRAHPQLPLSRISVEPHQVDTSALRKVSATSGPPLVIAVAGHVSAAKGALMLGEMARLMRMNELPMRIVVFGTLEHHDPSDGIEVLGAYSRSDLPALLEQEQVGICFLPSVCAETFSFVTAEYMAMDMPVAVFPVGAPAERVGSYHKGLVISRIDAEAAVAEIAAFAARIWPDAYSAQT
ncbi:glycosyltransferase [Lysobacter korlensis]|uniref:Glycosyltransferase n=1 Tax=Lysobacter korlensis TaxID=553636 RepID=A0ABV6RIP9_9GAMM